MTNQEAISILKTYGHNCRCCVKDGLEANKVAIDALEKQTEYQKKIRNLVNTIEEICKNSRDRHVDDEHCGLCEYDGAYVGESGEWANECPGFDANDCFVLSKDFRNKYIDWSEEE